MKSFTFAAVVLALLAATDAQECKNQKIIHGCEDYRQNGQTLGAGKWYDSGTWDKGQQPNCEWYGKFGDRCAASGSQFGNFGMTACEVRCWNVVWRVHLWCSNMKCLMLFCVVDRRAVFVAVADPLHETARMSPTGMLLAVRIRNTGVLTLKQTTVVVTRMVSRLERMVWVLIRWVYSLTFVSAWSRSSF